jgi:hypothetical protein
MTPDPASGMDAADAADDAAAAAGRTPILAPEPFRGGYAETPAETVERATRRGPQAERVHLSELVMRYPAATYTSVVRGLQHLADVRGHPAIRDTVAELVAEELERLAAAQAAKLARPRR